MTVENLLVDQLRPLPGLLLLKAQQLEYEDSHVISKKDPLKVLSRRQVTQSQQWQTWLNICIWPCKHLKINHKIANFSSYSFSTEFTS